MEKDELYRRINAIFMEWNPIGVDGPVLSNE
jgi:hypothetical protein